ncbi:MAG TPA: hypothetical protein VHY76_05535, partial [Acetobacteraceae bacterium]|nr:hypothetical protein [Acetobacteraceae bacterium]
RNAAIPSPNRNRIAPAEFATSRLPGGIRAGRTHCVPRFIHSRRHFMTIRQRLLQFLVTDDLEFDERPELSMQKHWFISLQARAHAVRRR